MKKTISYLTSKTLERNPSRARICKRLRRPEIDSENSIPPAYVAWRADKTNRAVVPARQAGNQFLGSLKSLQIRAQLYCTVTLQNPNLNPHVRDDEPAATTINLTFLQYYLFIIKGV